VNAGIWLSKMALTQHRKICSEAKILHEKRLALYLPRQHSLGYASLAKPFSVLAFDRS